MRFAPLTVEPNTPHTLVVGLGPSAPSPEELVLHLCRRSSDYWSGAEVVSNNPDLGEGRAFQAVLDVPSWNIPVMGWVLHDRRTYRPVADGDIYIKEGA